MSNQTPKPDPLLKNPQVLAALIGGIFTLVVAIVGIVPVIINANKANLTPTLIIITATHVPTTAAPPPTHTEVPLSAINTPLLASTDVPPTSTLTLPTDTPPPTMTPILPTATLPPTDVPPAPTTVPVASGNVLLLYDEVSFTLANQGNSALSLQGVVFRSAKGEWEARRWGSFYTNIPPGQCLRLRDAAVGSRQPPQPCTNSILGLMTAAGSSLFWIGVDQFEVVQNGQVIATCAAADQSCLVNIT